MKKRFWLFVFFFGLFTVPVVLAIVRKDQVLDKHAVDAKHTSTHSHFTSFRGEQVHYVERGNPDGETVLMIHGLGGFAYNFDLLMDSLSADYRLIAVDLPGFGMSDFPVLTDSADVKAMYRNFLTSFLDTLEVDSFHLIGNSMGGWISWEYAYENPGRVKSLTLLASAGYDIEQVRQKLIGPLKSPIVQSIASKGIPPRFKKLALSRLFYNKHFIELERADAWVDFMNRQGTIQTFFTLANTSISADTSKIEELALPTLVIWGEDDKIISASHAHRFASSLPNDSLILFPKCGHAPMIEYAGPCAHAIEHVIEKGLSTNQKSDTTQKAVSL